MSRTTRSARRSAPTGSEPRRRKIFGARGLARRSVCPVACTLDLIGDRWTILVIRDLVCGKAYFKEFLDSPEGIASNILAERLTRLSENGLVKRVASEAPGREAYRLTPRGASLQPILEQITAWGLANITGTEARVALK